MNQEAYWKVFLKSSDTYAGIIAAGDESYYGELDNKPLFETFNDMESSYINWSNPVMSDQDSYSGAYASLLNKTKIYSPSFAYKIPEKFISKKNLYVIFDAMILQNEANAAGNALFIVDISGKEGKTIFYKKFKVKKLPDEVTFKWKKEHIGFKLPEIKGEMEKIKFYIWNVSGESFMVDDLSIKIYEYH
jgi:hypothetical protein